METLVLNKSELVQRLETGVVAIRFIKIDGSERLMQATLSEALIPQKQFESLSLRSESSSFLTVWDLEAQGWRAFRLDSVLEA
jgi:hypothetical protein